MTPTNAPAAPTPEEVAALRAELTAVKETAANNERAAQFWHQKASAAAPAKPEKPAEEDDEDVLDLITSKGSKGLEQLLAKKGFVRAADVDKTVEERATQITREAELIGTYPELKDQKSDFFKATAAEYGALVKSGVPKAMAMEVAAQRVELAGIHSGSRKTRSQVEEEAKAEKERDRLARISAQGGDRGGGGGREENEDLTPEQRRIAISMLAGETGADGKPMTADQAVEAYKARAKNGVAVRGLR